MLVGAAMVITAPSARAALAARMAAHKNGTRPLSYMGLSATFCLFFVEPLGSSADGGGKACKHDGTKDDTRMQG